MEIREYPQRASINLVLWCTNYCLRLTVKRLTKEESPKIREAVAVGLQKHVAVCSRLRKCTLNAEFDAERSTATRTLYGVSWAV